MLRLTFQPIGKISETFLQTFPHLWNIILPAVSLSQCQCVSRNPVVNYVIEWLCNMDWPAFGVPIFELLALLTTCSSASTTFDLFLFSFLLSSHSSLQLEMSRATALSFLRQCTAGISSSATASAGPARRSAYAARALASRSSACLYSTQGEQKENASEEKKEDGGKNEEGDGAAADSELTKKLKAKEDEVVDLTVRIHASMSSIIPLVLTEFHRAGYATFKPTSLTSSGTQRAKKSRQRTSP